MLCKKREFALAELVLQVLGRRRHDEALPGDERRDQIGERLPGPGAGLDHEMGSIVDGGGHRLQHCHLSGTVMGAFLGREDAFEHEDRVGCQHIVECREPVGRTDQALSSGRGSQTFRCTGHGALLLVTSVGVQVLATLSIGEPPRHLRPSDLNEHSDIERVHPHDVIG